MKHYVESFPVYMPKLIREVDALSLSNKIVAVSEEQDGVAIHLNTALSTSEITELEQLIRIRTGDRKIDINGCALAK